MAARSKLLEILGQAAPTGVADHLGEPPQLSPVGTDAIPTPELEAATPDTASAIEPGGTDALMAAPDLTPEEQAQLQAELMLAAKQKTLGLI